MFYIKYLLDNEGFTKEIRGGFLLSLLSGDRPVNEIVSPNFQDQRQVMDNQFAGMSEETFRYEEYEAVRKEMVTIIHESLIGEDKKFLLSVKNVTPD